MAKDNKNFGDPFITGVVTIAYPYLAEARVDPKYDNKASYSVNLFIDKTDKETLTTMYKAIADAAMVNTIDEVAKHPFINGSGELRDGDDRKFLGKPGHAGRWFLPVRSDRRPQCAMLVDGEPVVLETAQDIKEQLYAGCKCRVILQAMMYEPNKVTLLLHGLLKVEDGERFGATNSIDIQNMFLAAAQGYKGIAKVEQATADTTIVEPPKTPAAKRPSMSSLL